MADFKRRATKKPGERNGNRRDFDRSERGNPREESRGGFNRGRGGPSRFKGRRDRPEMTEVTCDSCKKRCEVPFKPTANKPVYCDDCFKKGANTKSAPDLTEINHKLDKIMHALEID